MTTHDGEHQGGQDDLRISNGVAVHPVGGAVNVAPDATAYAHRHQHFDVNVFDQNFAIAPTSLATA